MHFVDGRSPGSLRARRAVLCCVDVQFSGDMAVSGNVGALYTVVDSSNAACTEPRRKLTRMGGNALMTADLPLRVGAGTLVRGLGWSSLVVYQCRAGPT